MKVDEIISGLQFTVDMFMFDPSTGGDRSYKSLNGMDKTTVDACTSAIELLKKIPDCKRCKHAMLTYAGTVKYCTSPRDEDHFCDVCEAFEEVMPDEV